MKIEKYTLIGILLLFVLSAILMLRQLMSDAYFSCIIQDTFEHTGWAWQFTETLKQGIIYPRWMPLKFWGYGSPIFVLYPPLAYYLVAFFTVFTGSVITAMNITKFLALFLSGAGMFFLVREFYPEKIALLTSSFYVVFPYTIFQFYCIGTFASTVSFMWFAPIILFAYRYMKNRHYRNILYAGLCYAGLILTHLVYAYIFSYVLVAFVLYMSVFERTYRNLTIIPAIIVLGILLSAAYILPLAFEKQFMHLDAITGEGFNFAHYFVLPDMTDQFPSGSVWPVYYNTFLFHMLFLITLTLLFFSQLVKNLQTMKKENKLSVTVFFIGIALWSMFLLFGISTFIWKTVPYFKYISFPFRWLNIAAFAIVFVSASGFWLIGHAYKKKRWNTFLLALLFLICLFLDYKYISSATFFSEHALLPVKVEKWVTTEYLPKWVATEKVVKKGTSKEKRVDIIGEGKATIIQWNAAERIIKMRAQEPLTVRMKTFYFPGWKAYLDDIPIPIKTEEGAGTMLIDVPKGRHVLILKFEDTPIRVYAKIISVITIVCMSFLFIVSRLKAKK
jgi:hypothetical protein